MTSVAVSPTLPTIPPEAHAFAAEKGVSEYLVPVIEAARQAFPSSRLTVSVAQDADNAADRYVLIEVDAGTKTGGLPGV